MDDTPQHGKKESLFQTLVNFISNIKTGQHSLNDRKTGFQTQQQDLLLNQTSEVG